MIRRGTSYGPMLPEGVLEDDGADRGIVFVFAGAHLGRQFEFVKTQWLNDGIFIGAPLEKDPLVGPNDGTGTFTVPAAADPPPAAGPAAVRRHPRRRVLLRPGPARDALAGGAGAVTGPDRQEEDSVATNPTSTDRWKALDFGPPPSGLDEPDSPVLVDYLAEGQVALITLNRPHADNAITTEMGARLTEIVETIAVRPAVRVVILTGAGERAFSVGSDLRQRKNMTKEDWLRQRQDFDRTLYTRAPAAQADLRRRERDRLRRRLRARPEHRLHHRLGERHLRAAGGDARSRRRRRLAGSAAPPAAPGQGPADADDRRPDHRAGGVPARAWSTSSTPRTSCWTRRGGSPTKIASNSPTAVQAVKRAVQLGEGQPIEQAIAIMMDTHWRSAVHPDRIEGIGAFNDGREPTFQDSDY